MSNLTSPTAKHAPTKTTGLNGGEQYIYKFPNGYGASVIRSRMSYGGSAGLFELAVLDGKGHLTYDTPVTDDVIGHLGCVELGEILDQIEALEPTP